MLTRELFRIALVRIGKRSRIRRNRDRFIAQHAMRRPGKISRIVVDLAPADLRHLALQPAQWGNQAQFALARRGRCLTAQKGDPAAVGRPDGAVIIARIRGQPQRSAGADLLHVDVGIVLFRAIPGERHVVSIRGK